ncbi:hypothetical protein [Klebsiella pneumoniae]|uniref:hypothetical protein n=1 Tax=Klebsiella pneumoniae TaxID=573 RepID=UPI003F601770
MNHTLSDSQLEAMIKSAVNSSAPLPPDEKFSQLISALRELQERRKADSEPIGYFGRFDPDDEDLIDQCSKNVNGAFPLYRHAQPAPVVQDGYVMVPMRLTAENGAKGALSGEFSETKFVNCPECFGDDECETCDGSGRIEITVPVTWTTIKEIWAKGVEHFSATPREVKGE